jgi:Bacterial PH domain
MVLAGHFWECIRMQGHGPQLPGAGAGQQAERAVAQAAAAAANGRAVPLLTEQKTFRLPGAPVAWWAWVIFAVACLADIAVTGRNHTAAEIAASLVFVTGIVYACALRPRVLADSSGITVVNPLRDHRIPWGSVAAVDLRESVQVHCVREPGAKRGKVIHSWALFAQRRSRLKAELIKQGDRRRLPRSAFDSSGGAAAEAAKLSKQPAAEIMAKQLDDLARQARDRGAAAGPRAVSWAWLPAAAIVAPGILLVLVITAFR